MSESITVNVEAEVSIYGVIIEGERVDFTLTAPFGEHLSVEAKLTPVLAMKFLVGRGYTVTKDEL